ncbi:uncharacterized protein BDR25DRAFT_375864 [Lindgomyces ingoldianus]|uniref:Uncharacterized protein n=1 Tax=Lindgomyces ingoldianus TaxID=673940 RepID=A0ACB6REK1_9PLEO|nr:uncharacterized protein BDR25DRAFT_375864 [Lindgomyces ingoldianus]KAF2476752.1 hypothetical protein BDR25DRAFT_375864 [Lindgomyces ingoldianus]
MSPFLQPRFSNKTMKANRKPTPECIVRSDTEMELAAQLVTKPRRLFVSAVLDWILKTLGAISAVIFGIWAPITYYTSVKWNTSNDESQRQLLEAITMQELMTRALLDEIQKMNAVQSRLYEEMAGVRAMVENVGELKAWEFCSQDSNFSAQELCHIPDSLYLMDTILQHLKNQTARPKQSSTTSPGSLTSSSLSDLSHMLDLTPSPLPTTTVPEAVSSGLVVADYQAWADWSGGNWVASRLVTEPPPPLSGRFNISTTSAPYSLHSVSINGDATFLRPNPGYQRSQIETMNVTTTCYGSVVLIIATLLVMSPKISDWGKSGSAPGMRLCAGALSAAVGALCMIYLMFLLDLY